MQTFVPEIYFEDCARCLDNKRLGKQRVETLQILKALTLPEYGWKNHPAVRMWQGHERALRVYGIVCCLQWQAHGFNDNVFGQLVNLELSGDHSLPLWWGDERMHKSHQSNLLRKDFKFYSKYGWDVPDNLPYFWPTKEGY